MDRRLSIGAGHPFAGMDIRTLIGYRAATTPHRPFLIWEPFEGESSSLSYLELSNKLKRFAAGLYARGVGLGDKILVHLDNCPESVIAWLGCAYAGATAVTTNARSSGDELSYYATHCDVVGAITQPKFAELVAKSCPNLPWIAITDHDNGADAGSKKPSSKDSFAAINGDSAPLLDRPADPLAPFSIQFTSGTTSRPKAVVWTHANALWGAKTSSSHEDLRPDDTHLCFLPLFHTNAQVFSILSTLWVGCTCVIQPKFSVSRFWQVALKRKCTWTSMVTFTSKALARDPVPDEHFFRLWGNIVCSPPSDELFRVKSIGWWGMTETISHGTVGDPFNPNRPMSVGRCSPEYSLRLVDADGGVVGPDGTGELQIKGIPGLSLFAGYYRDDAATSAAFTDDGYFCTGDRVTLFEDGFYAFSDRKKDMLKIGGENVAASEIERVILEVEGVLEAAVVGKAHPMLDEVPVVFVLRASKESHGLVERITERCRAHLADFKIPTEIHLVDELPRSTVEKVAKAKLRDRLRDNTQNDASQIP